MKLSERFDRRYQQPPAATIPPPPVVVPAPEDVAPPEPAPLMPLAAQDEEILIQPQVSEQTVSLSPALAAAKAEIHAQLLSHHTAQIDINNRAGIRRLLLQLTEEHFRNKPPAAIVTAGAIAEHRWMINRSALVIVPVSKPRTCSRPARRVTSARSPQCADLPHTSWSTPVARRPG